MFRCHWFRWGFFHFLPFTRAIDFSKKVTCLLGAVFPWWGSLQAHVFRRHFPYALNNSDRRSIVLSREPLSGSELIGGQLVLFQDVSGPRSLWGNRKALWLSKTRRPSTSFHGPVRASVRPARLLGEACWFQRALSIRVGGQIPVRLCWVDDSVTDAPACSLGPHLQVSTPAFRLRLAASCTHGRGGRSNARFFG